MYPMKSGIDGTNVCTNPSNHHSKWSSSRELQMMLETKPSLMTSIKMKQTVPEKVRRIVQRGVKYTFLLLASTLHLVLNHELPD